MIFVKRGSDGKILALSHINDDGFEAVDDDSPEVFAYLESLRQDTQLELLRADLQFIRVIEDVIDVLLKKNILNITDFPPAVIEKLLKRQSVRKRISNSVSMDFNDESDVL